VFSRENATLGGAEYHATAPPQPGDEIGVRFVHGTRDAYGATSSMAIVRVISVDPDNQIIEAHLIR
jgi:hypothetical protein